MPRAPEHFNRDGPRHHGADAHGVSDDIIRRSDLAGRRRRDVRDQRSRHRRRKRAGDVLADSGDTFPLGTTTVNCSATDDCDQPGHGQLQRDRGRTPRAPVIERRSARHRPRSRPPRPPARPSTTPRHRHLRRGRCRPGPVDLLPGVRQHLRARHHHGRPATATDAARQRRRADALHRDRGRHHARPSIDAARAMTSSKPPVPAARPSPTRADRTDLVDVDRSPPALRPPAAPSRSAPPPSTCTATDAAGNDRAGHASRSPWSTPPPPADRCPRRSTVEATGPGGAVVTYDRPDHFRRRRWRPAPPPARRRPAAPSRSAPPPSPATPSDAAGNDADADDFTVTVVDTTPPVIAAHVDVRPVEATGPGGAAVDYTSPAHVRRRRWRPGVATCVPASGSTFALGTTPVTCNATEPPAITRYRRCSRSPCATPRHR